MSEFLASYLVALAGMLFSGCSALTLFYCVRHFDPPAVQSRQSSGAPKAA